MNASRFLFLLCVLTTGCAPLTYQAVDLNGPSGESQSNGYIDKEIRMGVHIIEVRYENRSAFILRHEKTLHEMSDIWHLRASELCRKGYRGKPEVIRPDEARTDEFYCTLEVCQKYPVLSGVAHCKTTYEL